MNWSAANEHSKRCMTVQPHRNRSVSLDIAAVGSPDIYRYASLRYLYGGIDSVLDITRTTSPAEPAQ